MTKAFLPVLLKRPEAHIVNTSSMGGFLPVPGHTIYGASKAAVKLMTEGLWAELRGTRVRATVVFPGAVATNITANSGVDIPGGMDARQMEKAAARTLSADKAAQIILKGVTSDKARVLVGFDAHVIHQVAKLAGSRYQDFLARASKRIAPPKI